MRGIKKLAMLAAASAALAGVAGTSGGATNAADDPYAPLQLYDGKWDLAPSAGEKESKQIENHCAKTGLFFVCEQKVDGKIGALVVFLPMAKLASGGEEYRTQALAADASPAGEWSKLTIEGDRWVYSWESTEGGKKGYGRNVNIFSGRDKIHFEVQRSDDGNNWKVQMSGDERRVN